MEKETHLLSPRQVCRDVLGLTPDSKAWKTIRRILIEDYGMTHIEGVGMRIPMLNVQNFLAQRYAESKNNSQNGTNTHL